MSIHTYGHIHHYFENTKDNSLHLKLNKKYKWIRNILIFHRDGVTVLRWRVKLQKIHWKLVRHLFIQHMHLFFESSVTNSFYVLFNPISSQTVKKMSTAHELTWFNILDSVYFFFIFLFKLFRLLFILFLYLKKDNQKL